MKDIENILPYIKMKLNLDIPDFEDCYADGYESALQNKSEGSNPFNEDTSEAEQWLEGWWAGFYGEDPMYDNLDLSYQKAVTETKMTVLDREKAVNDSDIHTGLKIKFKQVLKIVGAISATAVVSYTILDMVA